MSKKVHDFNDIIRKLRKNLFGKGPDSIQTIFVKNKVICTMYGNLTLSEKFISQTEEGKEMIHRARTKLIQNIYSSDVPEGLEELLGSKFLHLFSDIKIEEDIAISVFVFEDNIE